MNIEFTSRKTHSFVLSSSGGDASGGSCAPEEVVSSFADVPAEEIIILSNFPYSKHDFSPKKLKIDPKRSENVKKQSENY